MSPRLEYRLRFSVAHEIGHLVLHSHIYADLQHATAGEWFGYISAIPEIEYGWVEWQAYEFAGRLLVPPNALREHFQTAIQTAEAAGYGDWLAADEAALDYIATRIAPKLGVSAEVIAKRFSLATGHPSIHISTSTAGETSPRVVAGHVAPLIPFVAGHFQNHPRETQRFLNFFQSNMHIIQCFQACCGSNVQNPQCLPALLRCCGCTRGEGYVQCPG
jgi:hypothetical protein